MKAITLSVHNGGNGKFRFFVPIQPSNTIFKIRKQKVKINIEGNIFETHTTCGPKDGYSEIIGKKGYDLYSSGISDWIIKKGYNLKVNGTKCKTFDFKWKRIGDWIILY